MENKANIASFIIMSWIENLASYRSHKNFDTDSYINAKCILLNEYLKLIDHSCIVIGVSGGIDSATVLGLVVKASTYDDSPIKKIVAVTIPEFVEGTVGQFESFYKARKLVNKLRKIYDIQIDFNCAELTDGHKSIKKYSGMEIDLWASGQLVSYARTAMLYGIISGYYSKGYPAILCGTTNFDEGSYIGYFGKASDGCVDIQLISDLHKSEVNKVAVKLQITDEIINAIPSGDLYNGQTDEQYIGSPYDFMELYFGYLLGKASITEKENPIINNWIKKIEKMREQAIHKYIGDGYAIRLKLNDDVIKKNVNTAKTLVDKTKFVNFVDLKISYLLNPITDLPKITNNKININVSDSIIIGDNILSVDECNNITSVINSYKWIPVATNGYLSNYKLGETIGSFRLTMYDEDFVVLLWNRLKNSYPSYINFKNINSVDIDNCSVWRPIGISPLIRFIKYETTANYLFPHYDNQYF
jgi:NAD+ synthetase